MEAGQILKRYRENAGITQEIVSDALSLTRSTLSSIESGRQTLTVKQLKIFCEAINLSLGKFAEHYGSGVPLPDLCKPARPKKTREMQIERLRKRLAILEAIDENNR